MMRGLLRWLPAMVLVAVLGACEHKELCWDHEHVDYSRVRIDVDWTRFLPFEIPTGMTVTMYPREEGRKAMTMLTNNTAFAVLNRQRGEYDMLVYNQSVTEFGSMLFQGMDSFGTARVRGVQVTSRWYSSRDDDEVVITPPEWLGVESMTGVGVTQAMVEKTNIMLAQSRSGRAEGDTVIATAKPQCVISRLHVMVHVKGLHNVRSARASITGLADGFMLGQMRTSDGMATQLLEEWTIEADKTDPTQGWLTTTVNIFGLPYGHSQQPEENLMRLELLLVDGKTVKTYDFAIGDQFETDAYDAEASVSISLNLRLEIDEALPDVEPEGGNAGGFDATVGDWGDEEEVSIEM